MVVLVNKGNFLNDIDENQEKLAKKGIKFNYLDCENAESDWKECVLLFGKDSDKAKHAKGIMNSICAKAIETEKSYRKAWRITCISTDTKIKRAGQKKIEKLCLLASKNAKSPQVLSDLADYCECPPKGKVHDLICQKYDKLYFNRIQSKINNLDDYALNNLELLYIFIYCPVNSGSYCLVDDTTMAIVCDAALKKVKKKTTWNYIFGIMMNLPNKIDF